MRRPAWLLLALSVMLCCSHRESKRVEFAHDEPGEALEYYLQSRVPPGAADLPVERYVTAQARIRRMRSRKLASGRAASIGAWEWLGPGNVGGRTRSLVIHPANPDIMYTGGVSGGVWKTVDGGKSWQPLGDLLPNIAVSSLALDLTNPDILYAGTGEGFGNFGAVRGGGIFKSTDAGATWIRLAQTDNINFFFVNKLIVSPFDGKRVYAATNTGLFRSLDGGESWEPSIDRGRATLGCQDIAIRPDRGEDYLFVACRANPAGSIWRNANASSTVEWERVFTAEFMNRTSLAIAPSQPSTVYALAASSQPGTCPNNPGPNPPPQCYADGMLGFYRSIQNGDPGTWETRARNTDDNKINTVLLSNPFVFFGDVCRNGQKGFNSQGWYDNVIAVDPKDPEKVWAGGVDLFRSDDGGANWGIASYWWDETQPTYVHADQHAIVFHPGYDGAANQTIFVTNDGGIYRTDNAMASVATGPQAACRVAQSAVAWKALNNNYGVTQFYHGSTFPGGHIYFAGAQDNGTQLSHVSQGTGNWVEILGGDGGYTAVHPKDARIVFTSVTRLSLRRSADGGITSSPATVGINEPATNFLFITPFRLDPVDPERMWLGGHGMWRSDSGGRSWRKASAELAEGALASISAIAISPADSNRVLAGNRLGDIFRHHEATTVEGDVPWARVRPRTGTVSWIEFDPKDSNVAYATYSTFNTAAADRHIYRSADGGATWQPADGEGDAGIPDIPVHSIAFHPEIAGTLYAGTDLGLFVTTDGGATWSKEDSGGIANTVVESLSFEKAGQGYWLFAFTYGRGAYRAWLGPGDRCSYSVSPEEIRAPASGGDVSFTVTAAEGCSWSALSLSRWLNTATPPNFTGTATVTYRAQAGINRTGGLLVADKLVRVIQSSN